MKQFFLSVISALFVTFVVCSPILPTVEVRTGPNCHMCEVILNNVRYEYHNNFTGVTAGQLRQSLYQQCDDYLNGCNNIDCHKKADQDSGDILKQLQDGTSSYRICQQEQFC